MSSTRAVTLPQKCRENTGGTIFYHLLLQFHTFPSISSPTYWQESHIGWGNVTSILRLIENSSYLEKTKRTLADVSTLAIST